MFNQSISSIQNEDEEARALRESKNFVSPKKMSTNTVHQIPNIEKCQIFDQNKITMSDTYESDYMRQ